MLIVWGSFKYTSQIYWKYTFEVYFKYTWSILQVYFNLLNYIRRSIPHVYSILTKEVHLKHICEIESAF